MNAAERQLPVHHLEWTPLQDAFPVAAGHWWDAARVEEPLGLAAVRHFRAVSPSLLGPVVADPRMTTPSLYFLTPPGTPPSWRSSRARILSRGSYVVIPHPDRTGPPGPYWLSDPRSANEHTDLLALQRFLDHTERVGGAVSL